MPVLRTLGGIFVAAGSVLAVTALLSRHPDGLTDAERGTGPAPHIEFYWSVPGTIQPQPPASAPAPVARSGPELRPEILPVRRTPKRLAAEHRKSKRHRNSEFAEVSASTVSEGSAPAAPASKKPPRNELAAVTQRLRNTLSDELFADFDLFLYVSKAVNGPLAQRMYVFRKLRNGALDLLYDWPVSTGRERTELNGDGLERPTVTPTGYFELDPARFYRRHTSAEWGEPMPFAMFFDWRDRGAPTGLAIHAATGKAVAQLGTRASAGCIRLAPEAAETLFHLIRTKYRGLAPRFAADHKGTTNSDGVILRDVKGRPFLSDGYKVLVVVQNYGGARLVAAIY
jgi:lipoprotein-anchoring transpeptidase ErfK/SrfK